MPAPPDGVIKLHTRTELDLNKMNAALYRLNDNPEAQLIAEEAFTQAHKFCNEHLYIEGNDVASTKSEILAMVMNDMSDEITNLSIDKII